VQQSQAIQAKEISMASDQQVAKRTRQARHQSQERFAFGSLPPRHECRGFPRNYDEQTLKLFEL
jgi:hypothetical protein